MSSEAGEEFRVVSEEFNEMKRKYSDPVFLGSMLSRVAEEKTSFNLVLKEINAKLDKIIELEERISRIEQKMQQAQPSMQEGRNFVSEVDADILKFVARKGACTMVGGEFGQFRKLESLFRATAAPDALLYAGKSGAGHFVKMVHNGIEYGMMQSLAEGFTILKKSKYKINLKKAAEIYNNGSVIESRLVGWLLCALKKHGQDFNRVSGKVGATGEGAWTVKTAKESKIKAKVLDDALKFRIKSQKYPDWTGKLLSALRGEFGGHKVK